MPTHGCHIISPIISTMRMIYIVPRRETGFPPLLNVPRTSSLSMASLHIDLGNTLGAAFIGNIAAGV